MDKSVIAKDLFSQKCHCSQAVLASFSDELGITEEMALKLASCFGGGMRKGEVCGACTGALMALGLKYGMSFVGDSENQQRADNYGRRFLDEFAEKNGSYLCRELLGVNISTEEKRQYAREQGLFAEKCPRIIESAVIIAERMMNDRMKGDNEINIRRFQNSDANELADVIAKTLRTSNSKDYSTEYIENDINNYLTAEKLIQRAEWTNFYVVCDEDKIIGCGAIGPYWGKEDESSLFTIFVLPEYQGRGIGRIIIETLEQDEYFLRPKRVEIPASITAVNFYRKMGYDYKNGITEPDDEQLYRLEKFR